MAKKKPGPKPNVNRVRSAVINVRCMPEWKAWIEEIAKHENVDVSEIIAEAVSVFARIRDYRKPPQR